MFRISGKSIFSTTEILTEICNCLGAVRENVSSGGLREWNASYST